MRSDSPRLFSGLAVADPSVNQAVRSLGLVAVLGEICCLCSAMLFLPGWLSWRERMKHEQQAQLPSAGAHEAPGA